MPFQATVLRGMRSERPQKIQDILPLASLQPIETIDDFIRLTTCALVVLDSLHKITRPAVMQEENTLPDTPERRRSELIRPGAALRDAIRKPSTHVVNENVGEQIYSLIRKRGTGAGRRAARNHPARGE